MGLVARSIGWTLSILAAVVVLSMPVMAGMSDAHAMASKEDHAAHMHNAGDNHSQQPVRAVTDHGDHHAGHSGADHNGHATCDMTACCPLQSVVPSPAGRVLSPTCLSRSAKVAVARTQAAPETSDKPPRLT